MAAKANSYTRDRDLVIKTDTESEYESETDEEENIYYLKIKPTITVQPQPAVMDNKIDILNDSKSCLSLFYYQQNTLLGNDYMHQL